MNIYKFNNESEVKQFSLKLLPNIDNLKENTIYVESYYRRNGEKITKNDYWDARYNGENNVVGVRRYFSYALLNGEYCIFPFSETIKKFISFALDKAYYIIKSEDYETINRYLSIDEYERFKKSSEYDEMKENDSIHLIEKVVISNEPINLYGIDNDWSIKFETSYVHDRFLKYENLRFEKDSSNLIWDGTIETKDKVQEFLKNKDLKLDDLKNDTIKN
jgi:hypothetical protein